MRFLFPLLASALMAHAAPAVPGQAAVEFLEKVRLGQINLEPGGDTALSPQTAEAKKKQIARRLERMAIDLGTDPLEIGTVKEDGDFAGVMVRKGGGFDPSRLQVFPVALLRKATGWMVAPVPASFENAGAGYSIALSQRLESLEDWMLRQQVDDLEKLREQSAIRMREEIEARLTARELREYDSGKAGLAFLTACERRELPSVLGLLGGLSNPLPLDWPVRLKAAEKALRAGTDGSNAWRALLAPEILRLPVHHEEQGDKGLFSIAYLDPAANGAGKSGIHVVHLELSKSGEGFWQVDLPPEFLVDPDEPRENSGEEPDTDLIQRFATEWSRTHPPTPQPTAELARNHLVASLRESSPAKTLRMAKPRSRPEAASADCLGAARFWSPFHDSTHFRHAIPLAMKTGENLAVGLLQVFSSRETARSDIRPLYFEKTSSGWLWIPIPETAAMEEFKVWIDAETSLWSDKWQEQLLSDVTVLGKELQPPTAEEARECMESWLAAIRSGDLAKALSLSARLSSPKSGGNLLRNTGYEILAMRRNRQSVQIHGLYAGNFWTAAGIKALRDNKPSHPFYPMVKTAAGTRILVETDLVASANRSRDYLNRDALQHLARSSSDSIAEDLKTLLGRYQADISSGTTLPDSSR